MHQETAEHQVHPATLAPLVPQAVVAAATVEADPLDLQDPLELQEPQALLATLAPTEPQATLEPQDLLAKQENLVPQDRLVVQGLLAIREQMPRGPPQEPQDQRDPLVNVALQDLLATQEPKVRLVLEDPPENVDLEEIVALTAAQADQDLLELQDLEATMPSTALVVVAVACAVNSQGFNAIGRWCPSR